MSFSLADSVECGQADFVLVTTRIMELPTPLKCSPTKISNVFDYAFMHELFHDPIKIKLVPCGALSLDAPRKNHGTNTTKAEAWIAACYPQSSTRGLQRSMEWGWGGNLVLLSLILPVQNFCLIGNLELPLYK